jgi:hypothetical protein
LKLVTPNDPHWMEVMRFEHAKVCSFRLPVAKSRLKQKNSTVKHIFLAI